MASSDKLRNAKDVKNDEFYTRLEDIELELKHYKKDYNSDVEDIMGREEKVEKFYKRSTFIKKMKSPINSFYNKVFFMIRIGYFRHRYFICNG